ncbi:MAG: hypothetical protein H7338_02825 [Candidatus Sericytochromatia bacterium]|nr:hypothetical protein [Candidatus Sericytochromatia bacterium]
MTRIPSPRPVRLAQQICRLAGVAYMMIGAAVVGILVVVPQLSGKGPNQNLFAVQDGVWTSTTLWWDGIINPIFHGMVFFVLSSALGYLAELGEILIDREYEQDAEAEATSNAAYSNVPDLTTDDLQPLK